MRIDELGGEFALIRQITAGFPDFHGTATTVGDDAAVVPRPDGAFAFYTTDTLVEGVHFRLQWSSPAQVGIKTVEANVSDIAAMGGRPEFLLLNLVLPPDTQAEFVFTMYEAIRRRCEACEMTLLGGDTTSGPALMVSATVTGIGDRPVYRRGAQVGDLICVTGDVGAAQAGIQALKQGQTRFGRSILRHLEPRCRLDLAQRIAPIAHAMIDVSDGIGSEVRHICQASNVGAVIDTTLLPIHPETKGAAEAMGADPVGWALSGGEDYQLLFTTSRDSVLSLLDDKADVTVIGRIADTSAGIVQVREGKEAQPLSGGHDHFER